MPERSLLWEILPPVIAFVVTMAAAPAIIKALTRLKMGQVISEDAPASHQTKANTPSMGGLIILIGLFAGWITALLMGADAKQFVPVMVLVLAYAALGAIDDYLTIRPRGNVRGISSKPKAAIQFLLAIAFVLFVCLSRPWGENEVVIGDTGVLSGWLYIIFAVLFVSGLANFVNITDGLDGLVSGLTVFACVPLTLMYSGVGAYPLFASLGAAALAFLWFNTNPARVFMGDTGSLAIGAALAGSAIVYNAETLAIIACLVFILDGLTSAIQWAVFKYTRIRTGTGRRVFKKSPIHHHFELSGWPEQTVVVRFWIIGIAAATAALMYTLATME